jgi:hypothetical protein
MKHRGKHPGLDTVLLAIKMQAADSFDFADSFLPAGKMSPGEIFDYLRGRVIYTPDPPRVELLQSMQTLFTDNRNGTPGAGDCDCFTIAGLASLYVKGHRKLYVTLAGRSSANPVHVYCTWRDVPFDLTTEHIGFARPYRHIQDLPCKF